MNELTSCTREQVLFSNCVALVWNTYLSHVTHHNDDHVPQQQ